MSNPAGPPEWVLDIVAAARTLDAAQLSGPLPSPPASARPSAVLVLFAESPTGPGLLLIERAHDLRSHAGQLAFPGGATDPGESAVDTALREASEEIGLDPAGVEVLAELPPLWLPPSNFAVTCVLGWWRTQSPVGVVDPVEVAAVLRVPLADLIDPGHRVTVSHPSGYRGPGFVLRDPELDASELDASELDDLVLWGFTAWVVAGLLERAGIAQPWDESRTLPAPVPGSRGRVGTR